MVGDQTLLVQIVLLGVGVGWGVLGYTSTEKFRRDNGVTPWGWPSVIWAFAWFLSILFGALLWTIAVNRTRKHLAAPRPALVPAAELATGAAYDPFAPPAWSDTGAAPPVQAAFGGGDLAPGLTPDGVDSVGPTRVDGATGPGARRATLVAVTAVAVYALLAGGLVLVHHRSTLQVQLPATLGGLATATDPALQTLRTNTQGQLATQANGAPSAVGTYGTVTDAYAMLELARVWTSPAGMATFTSGVQSGLPAGATVSAATQVGDSQCVTISLSAGSAPAAAVCARTSLAANLTVIVLVGRGDATQASSMVDEAWGAQP